MCGKDRALADGIIFSCKDRWGREIVLTESRWHIHVIDERKRDFLVGQEAVVRSVIENPLFVMFDRMNADREQFYGAGLLPPPYHQVFIKVCVEFDPPRTGVSQSGFVVTVFLTDEVHPRERQKWSRYTSGN